MKIVKNTFAADSPNAGDIHSSPLLYFNIPGCYSSFLSTTDHGWWRTRADAFIIGGGGIFHKSIPSEIRNLVDRRNTYEADSNLNSPKLILWGAGTNVQAGKRSPAIHDMLSRFDLVGIRDWDVGYRWVPCVSCMDPVFDSPPPAIHDFVVYDNIEVPVPTDPKFPRMNNWHTSIEKSVAFLATGRMILTSSYHGVYWAQLMGRPVMAFPNSSKFYHMRRKPTMCTGEPWINVKRKVKPITGFLQECRDANVAFHKDVVRLIERIK